MSETPPDRAPSVRVIAMPGDANPDGDIFGGWLMSQMDLAAGNAATLRAGGRAVTVAVEGMSFMRPVLVGDEVSVYASVASAGRTSLRISVEAWRRARAEASCEKVTQAVFTFVAVDGSRRPRTLPNG